MLYELFRGRVYLCQLIFFAIGGRQLMFINWDISMEWDEARVFYMGLNYSGDWVSTWQIHCSQLSIIQLE
jgi:hypothetical protein